MLQRFLLATATLSTVATAGSTQAQPVREQRAAAARRVEDRGRAAVTLDNRIDVVTPLAPELAAFGAHTVGVRTITVTDRNRPDIVRTKPGEAPNGKEAVWAIDRAGNAQPTHTYWKRFKRGTAAGLMLEQQSASRRP